MNFPSISSQSAKFGETSDSGPAKVSTRTMRAAIEDALIYTFTRTNLELVLGEELELAWEQKDIRPEKADTKRALVDGYIHLWQLPQLVACSQLSPR